MLLNTVALCNLGCSKNIVDGEYLLQYLQAKGMKAVEEYEEADCIVVNTCTFIQEATQEAIDSILEMAHLKKDGRLKKLIVSGCFSERYRQRVQSEFSEVDHWIGVHSWKEELDLIFPASTAPALYRTLSEPLGTQYLKTGEGCSHNCAFCIIPSVRGPFKSRPEDEIIAEGRWLYEQGARECILVSQDTSRYGRDRDSTLSRLLERMLGETDFPWIRMMYLHPAYVDDTLLRLVASEPRICSYFDIPLQHIADPVLKGMKRHPLGAGTRALVERIRTLVPDAAIRSSFIVGFPGETQRDFEELLSFVEQSRFERLGVFPFSPEEGTVAATLRPRPRTSTAQQRCETLMELQQSISRELCERHVGKELEVFIDEIGEGPYNFEARTQWDAPEVDGKVLIRSGSYAPGSFARVRIVDADDHDLYAE
jgi:ribosomal protein S12 methylthiotransferase